MKTTKWLSLLLTLVMVLCLAPSSLAEETEIRFYAQAYTDLLKPYAASYEAEHPGVKISFVELPGDAVMNEWVRTQAAAGTLADIFFLNYSAIGNELPTTMFTGLNQYLDMDNPYVPGTKWSDNFNAAILSMMQKGNGEHYTVSCDYVETGIFYNVEMLKNAGVEEMPKNWEEFVEVCKKVKEAGYEPFAWSMSENDTFSLSWTNRIFLSNVYADIMDQLDLDHSGSINAMEEVVAFKNGLISVGDGKFLSYFDALKALTPYLNSNWSAAGDLETKFMKGEVAMYWTGSWLPQKMRDAGIDFEYSSFPFPTPTENTIPGVTTNVVTSGAVGGPSGGFQYCVSSAAANKTLTDEKLSVIVDFLMYISQPTIVSDVVNAQGSFAPTVTGATLATGNEGLLDNLNADYTVFDGVSITGTMYDTLFRYLHQYMMDEVTMEQCVADLSAMIDEEIENAIMDNPDWNIDQYLK